MLSHLSSLWIILKAIYTHVCMKPYGLITQLQGIKAFGVSGMSPRAFVHVKQMLSYETLHQPMEEKKRLSQP